jgi:gamma-glutamylcyclotransferase (GGCT)/AIG2-like uncharacterized protein YtfP
MERLFVYGSLKDPAVQQRILGRVIDGTPDTLEEHTTTSLELDDGVFPILRPQSGCSVSGLILDLTPDELAQADDYESTDYQRIRVRLVSGEETWVYSS